MLAIIPESHRDLIEHPIVVTLCTVMADGSPQSSPVWFSANNTHIWINTMVGRQKDVNMRARPMVSILSVDPDNPYRYLEIRGIVQEIDEESGLDHINYLSDRYLGQPDFYSDKSGRGGEQRVIFKIKPLHVVAH